MKDTLARREDSALMTQQQEARAMSTMALPNDFASQGKGPFASTNPLPSQDFYSKVGNLMQEMEQRHWKNHVFPPEEVLS
jgi:hypothetical protein